MREHVADESVDLIYLDPPFNSNANYNVLFRERSGEESPAQIKAFTDTWEWTQETERAYELDIIASPRTPVEVKEMVAAFRQFVGRNAMMAYLVMMAPRLVELRRVLKPTGSIYLHCDPTASHYLKLLMDSVFGVKNFKNEIVWKRTSAHSDSKALGRTHDIILLYAQDRSKFSWNIQYQPYDQDYIKSHYRHKTEKGRLYRTDNLTATGLSGGGYEYEWNGVTRVWRAPRRTMERWQREGRIHYTRNGIAEYVRYLDEMPGMRLQDVWTDLPPINSQAKERLGYPTQKPQALLERIIQASSKEGDVVLDPFCGCGSAVAAAEKLGRRWIGIDVTHLAVALIKNRLKTAFSLEPRLHYQVVGEPLDVGSARALWEMDPYQFQFWAISLLEAQPRERRKRGADRGIDGLLYFIDGPRRSPQKVVVQVKGGRVSSPHVRDLRGVVEREKAALGLFITLEEPTREMRREASGGGLFHSVLWNRDYPKIQIRSIADLLEGRGFEMPPRPSAYQPAQRVHRSLGEQGMMMEAAMPYADGA